MLSEERVAVSCILDFLVLTMRGAEFSEGAGDNHLKNRQGDGNTAAHCLTYPNWGLEPGAS